MMKSLLHAVLAIIFLIVSFSLPAAGEEGKSISAEVTPREVTVGEGVTCRLTLLNFDEDEIQVSLPEEKKYWPHDEADSPGPVPLYAVTGSEKLEEDDSDSSSRQYVVTIVFFRPGTHPVPLIDIRDRDGNRVAYRQPEITVKAVNEKGTLADIEPPVVIGTGTKYWIFFLIGGVVLLLAGFGVYHYISTRRGSEPSEDTPSMQPYDIFDNQLHSLLLQYSKNTAKHEWFITSLDHAFRQFLSRQLGVDAMEMTSGEISDAVQSKVTPLQWEYHRETLKKLYTLWDAVKFAEYEPAEVECRRSAELAREGASRMRREVLPVAT